MAKDHGIPVRNEQQQQQKQQQQLQGQRRKCHGDRKAQRFRKKCRARGMKPATIEKLLEKRKHQMHQQKPKKKHVIHTTSSQTSTTNMNKRKRDISSVCLQQTTQINSTTVPKSTSSISIGRLSSTKKKKKHEIDTMSISCTQESDSRPDNNYRRPRYLERASSILFQMLSKRLNYSLTKKPEQTFVYVRLSLLDRYYCLDVDLQLWQSYLRIGLEHHKWPEQLFEMAQTHDFELCQQFLVKHIEEMKKQMNQYQIELRHQAESCPLTTLTLNQIDACLNEFVNCQREYLKTRNNDQLNRFKNEIQASNLFETITTYYPTLDQNTFTSRLITIREKQAKIWQDQLMLETRILCKFLPPDFDHLQRFISPITYVPLNNDQKAVEINYKTYKMIQKAKRQWLDVFFSAFEINLEKHDEQYEEIFRQLETLLLNHSSTSDVDGRTLLGQITRYMSYRTDQLKDETSHAMSTYRRKTLHHRQCSSMTKTMIGVSPKPYLDLVSNPFTKREWNHLSLGPSYIRLNQSAIRPMKQQRIQIKNQHKHIYQKVEKHLFEHQHMPKTAPILKQYSTHLLNYFHDTYFAPLSYPDQLQAQEQAHIARSIRHKLHRHGLILRETDKSNIFYIGSKMEYEKKAQKFFSDTNAFTEQSHNPFDEILQTVINLLNRLAREKRIFQWQAKQMMPDSKQSELSHLYFNPKTHKDGIPVRPIESTIHSPTTKISKFLDRYLRCIFNEKCSGTTIIDGAHLIKNLDTYAKQGRLKPSTLFCTFDIRNLYTMLPQDGVLDILVEFLEFHGYTRVKGIDLGTIKELASIVLEENFFVYEKKVYKQTTGGAMGSALTLTLANIFMWKWQRKLVDEQNDSGEYFGRYIDDLFMTWNKSEQDLRKLLDDANQWHPNIKFDYQIGQSLPFLDVLVTNNNGILSTAVYHKPAAEPYVVPYLSDHPRHVFRNIIQTALTQAVRYSSTFQAFRNERRYIKLKLLYNGYPSSFIDNEFRNFHRQYASLSTFIPYLKTESEFSLMRTHIIQQPTPRQSQVAIDTAQVNTCHDSTSDEQIESETSTHTIDTKKTNNEDRIIVHYTHEKRFISTKRDMHAKYEDVFKNTPAMHVKLIVGNRNRRSAKDDLIRKKPRK